MDNYQNIDMNFITISSTRDCLKDHYHNGYELIFITEGQSNFVINNSSYDFCKNSFVFINNVEKHKMYPLETPYSRYMVIIDTDYLDSIIQEPALLSIFKIRPEAFKHGFKIQDKDVEKVKTLLNQLLLIYSEKRAFWHIEYIATFTSLLLLIYRQYSTNFPIMTIRKAEQRIFDIQKYIDHHFKSDITLDSIASNFYMDKYYLAHTFKDITGFTIKQYILLKRVSFAKNQLFYTDKNITNIAIDSGFNSQSNFIRLFKKKEAITPLQFRKRYRKG
ncbi:AraC-like DNA-binding protein [Natranaerovirga hydrolytica]|uniref:AraC-like DNA-binding protein n=1 Tax=Natranaerovirga hydrolytica TaxID=680378 RepID=A0A4R1N153_9FIRM|nr:AraC family transcriptional regulator [Natranaerovirga hydrolytica]TCK98642.1 AraC-like DNA-binding protein [Natranaerovirga hydrolytica]